MGPAQQPGSRGPRVQRHAEEEARGAGDVRLRHVQREPQAGPGGSDGEELWALLSGQEAYLSNITFLK